MSNSNKRYLCYALTENKGSNGFVIEITFIVYHDPTYYNFVDNFQVFLEDFVIESLKETSTTRSLLLLADSKVGIQKIV